QDGAWNALGAVKIDMPNSYSVYMHDTNQRNLFSDDYRFDSHGCSRVDNVRDLAAWLLQEEMPKWNRAAIDAAIATGGRLDVTLPKKVPVGVYLSRGMKDKAPPPPFPQRHQRPGRAAPETPRRGSRVLQRGGKPSAD